MTPVEQLTTDMKNAMREKNREALDAIRFLLAQVRNAEIDTPNHAALTDEEFTKIVQKLVKNAEEAIAQYREGDREDLATEEERKVKIWKQYLPEQLSESEIEAIVDEILASLPQPAQMGPAIGQVMKKVAGRADGGTISRVVREKLQS